MNPEATKRKINRANAVERALSEQKCAALERDAARIADDLLCALRPVIVTVALMMLNHRGSTSDPLVRWVGTPRQWRKAQHELAARGIVAQALRLGGDLYIPTDLLRRLPELLARPIAPMPENAQPAANDVEDEEGERIANELARAVGAKLGPRRRQSR